MIYDDELYRKRKFHSVAEFEINRLLECVKRRNQYELNWQNADQWSDWHKWKNRNKK